MPKIKLKRGDCIEVLKSAPADYADSIVTDPPAGISFMGKEWDSDKGGRDAWIAWMTDVMRECHRVLKPGGHALVWAIPRTSHWTATALENAGFEIRDVVTHLFGSGFPKSMDISKAIDKAAGAEREVVGPGKRHASRAFGQGAGDSDYGTFAGGVPPQTAPATDAAKQWEGFGTALKPASEHWILCRKPLGEKTVAANVLKHGTGGLNIDGCRIATTDNLNGGAYSGDDRASKDGAIMKIRGGVGEYVQPTGRFPANLVLSHNDDCDDACTDGCAVAELDRQSGDSKSPKQTKQSTSRDFGVINDDGWAPKGHVIQGYGDNGGASRFFYVAKASKRDKGDGNSHPTVKSTKLMEYLIRLVTPPGGIVLDPFMGSGSTGVAAVREGFGFVGIEMSEEYFEIASKRINAETDDEGKQRA